MTFEDAVLLVQKELHAAMQKWPDWPTDAVHAAAVVAEEAGELTRASLRYHYEGEAWGDMPTEAMQTAAMAIRFMMNAERLKR